MHKQFQRFGFFVTNKDINEDTKVKDKYLKYLYKKETASPDKSGKRRIKSANDTEPVTPKYSRKYQLEEKPRNYKKRSSDSLGRKHKRKEPLSNSVSETEIFFISPEDIKKHRRKSHQSRERSPAKSPERPKHSGHRSLIYDQTLEKRKTQKKEDSLAKLLKQQKYKSGERDDYQWLTKKEIFKLIGNVQEVPKNSSTSSNFFKKFFIFDKPDTLQNKTGLVHAADKRIKKVHRCSEDNSNMLFIPYKTTVDSTTKKLEKISKVPEKRTKESPTALHARDSRKHHDKSKSPESHNMHKHHTDADNGDVSLKGTKKRKPRTPEEKRLVFEELKTFQAKEAQKLKAADKSQEKKTESGSIRSVSQTKIKLKSKTKRKSKDQIESSDVAKEESTQILQTLNRTNPVRHKFCLVKNTFSVCKISPGSLAVSSFLENKKKLKSFKKYYKYNHNNDKDSEVTTSTTYHTTFSDSHKMYQDNLSEKSIEDVPKEHHRRTKAIPSDQDAGFKLETLVSSVVIDPEPQRMMDKPTQSSKDGDKKSKRSKTQKSKIPVPNKIVELAKDSPSPSKSRKKSADLFVPCVSKEQELENPRASRKSSHGVQPSSPREKSPRNAKEKTVSGANLNKDEFVDTVKMRSPSLARDRNAESFKEKILANSRPASERSSIAGEKPSSAKPLRPQSVPSKAASKEDTVSSKTKFRNPRPSSVLKIDRKDSRISGTSAASKQSKMSSVDKRLPFNNFSSSKNRISSRSPSPYRRQSESYQKPVKSPSKLSNDASSSGCSKGSKKSNKTSQASKSDTKLERNRKMNADRKYKAFDRSSAKTSLSNSTFGDRSIDSSKNGTSFFLTKTYKDDDKLNRWHKRKLYSDTVRKNLINKNQKPSALPSQILEVRYMTVVNDEAAKSTPIGQPLKFPATESKERENRPGTTKEFYDDDLPDPYFELIETDKFKELFELPIDKALNDILYDNYTFLKKDFSRKINDLDKSSSSEDLSGTDLLADKNSNGWYDFRMTDPRSLSEISCCRKTSDLNLNMNLGSEDHIVDSLSAPGSEESGYATIMSRPISRTFFERPDIKALFQPPFEAPLESYCVEVQIQRHKSPHCEIHEIRSIESKSLQTAIECSHKSVQIKLSHERVVDKIEQEETSGTENNNICEEKEPEKEEEEITANKQQAEQSEEVSKVAVEKEIASMRQSQESLDEICCTVKKAENTDCELEDRNAAVAAEKRDNNVDKCTTPEASKPCQNREVVSTGNDNNKEKMEAEKASTPIGSSTNDKKKGQGTMKTETAGAPIGNGDAKNKKKQGKDKAKTEQLSEPMTSGDKSYKNKGGGKIKTEIAVAPIVNGNKKDKKKLVKGKTKTVKPNEPIINGDEKDKNKKHSPNNQGKCKKKRRVSLFSCMSCMSSD